MPTARENDKLFTSSSINPANGHQYVLQGYKECYADICFDNDLMECDGFIDDRVTEYYPLMKYIILKLQ